MIDNEHFVIGKLINIARKKEPADIVLKNGRIVNVFSHEIQQADLAISEGKIAAVGVGYEGHEEIDLKQKIVSPGFIDGHVHIESSMVPIPEFARIVVAYGTTTVIIDPHEIANVMGISGIAYMLKTSKYNPLNVFMMLPSCVPATPMETAGAELKAIDLYPMFQDRWVIGLGEVMNYPGVLNGHSEIIDKIKLSQGKIIDGHAPGLTGPDLNAYIAAGMKSDHECTTLEEAKEKLSLGMQIMIREGTSARNLESLIPLVNSNNLSQCCFVTDDRTPADLLDRGHINHIISKAIQLGLDPISAIKMATINTARYFGLKQIGAIAPGFDADLAIIDSFENFSITDVYKNGKKVAENGSATYPMFDHKSSMLRGSVNVKWIEKEHFIVKPQSNAFRVIQIQPGQLTTQCNIEKNPRIINDNVVSDPNRDILKIVVIERHYHSGNTGIGFIKGFGIKKGAMAGTIAHDSHNIIAVGANDEDIYQAVVQLVRQQGGLALALDGKVINCLPLPIAGLMSDQSMHEVRNRHDDLVRIVHSFGSDLEHPFMMLSFMALPVIPELKLTDKGLFDTNKFEFVDLFV